MKRHEHPNAKKWLQPPTIEQVDAVVKKSGASEPMFESFYGIAIGCIAKFRCGYRNIPLKHWHIFLEDNNSNIHKYVPKTPRQRILPKQKINADSRLTKLI